MGEDIWSALGALILAAVFAGVFWLARPGVADAEGSPAPADRTGKNLKRTETDSE